MALLRYVLSTATKCSASWKPSDWNQTSQRISISSSREPSAFASIWNATVRISTANSDWFWSNRESTAWLATTRSRLCCRQTGNTNPAPPRLSSLKWFSVNSIELSGECEKIRNKNEFLMKIPENRKVFQIVQASFRHDLRIIDLHFISDTKLKASARNRKAVRNCWNLLAGINQTEARMLIAQWCHVQAGASRCIFLSHLRGNCTENRNDLFVWRG